MQDMASGSDAALQMQKNMVAAPDVQQAQANVMQEQALKLEQERATVEKTKLGNIVTESGIQLDKQKQAAIAALEKSAGYEQLSGSEKAMKQAMTIMSFDPAAGGKLLDAVAVADLKEAQAQAKTLDNAREQINMAASVIGQWPDDKVGENFKKLPEASQKAVIDKVGQQAWDEMDGKAKKKVVDNLFLSTNQKVQEQRMALDLEKTKLHNAMELEKVRLHNLSTIAAREARAGKASNMWTTANKELDSLRKDPDRVKAREKLDADVEDAEVAAKKSTWIGGYESTDPKTQEKQTFNSKAAYDKWQSAVQKRDKYIASTLDDEQAIIETLPEEAKEIKNNMLERVKKQRLTLSPEDAPKPAPKPDAGTPAPAADVPSNKGGDGTQGKPLAMPADKSKLVHGKYYDIPGKGPTLYK
jgi:hypothetical protein